MRWTRAAARQRQQQQRQQQRQQQQQQHQQQQQQQQRGGDADGVRTSIASTTSGDKRTLRPVATGIIVTAAALFLAAIVNNFSLLYKVSSTSSTSSAAEEGPWWLQLQSLGKLSKNITTANEREQGQQQQQQDDDPKTIFWKRSMKSLRESINNNGSHNNKNRYVSLVMTRECADLLLLSPGRRGHEDRTEEETSPAAGTMVRAVRKIQKACHYHHTQTQTQTPSNEQNRLHDPNGDDDLPLPLVVAQTRGEMGNHLGSLGHGIGLQLWLQQKHNLATGLVVLHQLVTIQQDETPSSQSQSSQLTSQSTSPQSTKSTYRWGRHGNSPHTIRTLQQCFPLLSNMNYELGMPLTSPDTWIDGFILQSLPGGEGKADDNININTTHLLQLARRIHNVNGANPRTWIDSKATPPDIIMDRRRVPVTPQLIEDGLNAAVEVWNIRQKRRQRQRQRQRRRQFDITGNKYNDNTNHILLYSESLDNRAFAAKYKRAFQTLFALDEQNPKCCILPPPIIPIKTSERDIDNDNDKKNKDTDEDSSNHHVVVEHLFHFRNFGLELLGVEKKPQKQAAAFEEVTPQQLHELLKQYSGDSDLRTSPNTTLVTRTTTTTTTTAQQQQQQQHRVTILTRRRSKHEDLDSTYEDPTLKEFVNYLSQQDPPISVNVAQGHSGVQDFCSIIQYVRRRGRGRGSGGGIGGSSSSSDKQTKTEGGLFIGPQRSTFSEWGTILGSTADDDNASSSSNNSSNNNNRTTVHEKPSAVLYAIHSNALEKQYSPNTLQFFDGNRYDSNYALLMKSSMTFKNRSVSGNSSDDGDDDDTSIRRVLINP
eukprot:CAMPEP_0113459036 /NCGR_PEP_ID=MMETSP0014_2-20120614/10237_1 /TAXON_ID=2857 /ORGANISM="Nitzschia sp." /LENGTH=821 /DNA_ID=CAMNT_0000350591 /DNA_START=227 /DNA_END=2692 /DNA_ORIENTATION=+ /assembly_acc=CAM_ASM_000159